jgi:hypothetical protein
MRKLPLILLASLLVVAVSCSSSKKSGSSTSTTAASNSNDPQVKQVCAATKQFTALIQSPGSDAAAYKADATKLQAIATQISTNAPAAIASDAKATADALNQAAAKVSSATSASQANTAMANVALNLSGNKSLASFASWQSANC